MSVDEGLANDQGAHWRDDTKKQRKKEWKERERREIGKKGSKRGKEMSEEDR